MREQATLLVVITIIARVQQAAVEEAHGQSKDIRFEYIHFPHVSIPSKLPDHLRRVVVPFTQVVRRERRQGRVYNPDVPIISEVDIGCGDTPMSNVVFL